MVVAQIQPCELDFDRNPQEAKALEDTGEGPGWQEAQHPEHDYRADELTPRRDRSIALEAR